MPTQHGSGKMINGQCCMRGRTSTGAIDEGSETLMVSELPPNRRADAYCFESLASIHMDEEQGHLLRRVRTAARR